MRCLCCQLRRAAPRALPLRAPVGAVTRGPCSMPSGLRRRRPGVVGLPADLKLPDLPYTPTCLRRPGARRRHRACGSRRGRRARAGRRRRGAAARRGRAQRRPRLRVPHPARRALGHHAAAARGARQPGADLCAARVRSGPGQVPGGILLTDAMHRTLSSPLRLRPETRCTLQNMRGMPGSVDSAALARLSYRRALKHRHGRRPLFSAPHRAPLQRLPRARALPRRAWA